MVINPGRLASAFKKILRSFLWGGDLVPDADDTQSIGSDTIGISELHIAPDGLIKNVVGAEYGIRNSADTVYGIWGCIQLNVAGTSAIVEVGDAKVLGNVAKAPSVVIMTTAQRNALTGRNGMIIYNSDLDLFEIFENSQWRELITKEKFFGVHSEEEEFDYAVHSLMGAAKDNFTGIFPHDMRAILEMVIVVIPKQDDVVLAWTTVNAAFNEAANTHVDAGNINVNIGGITDKIFEIVISAEFATALAKDYFGIEVTGNAGDVLKILGIRLRYR